MTCADAIKELVETLRIFHGLGDDSVDRILRHLDYPEKKTVKENKQ